MVLRIFQRYLLLMRELQTQGYVCVAPDMPGHGATSKPPPASFAYDLPAYQNALSEFLDALALGSEGDSPIDLVVSGFFTSQAARSSNARSWSGSS